MMARDYSLWCDGDTGVNGNEHPILDGDRVDSQEAAIGARHYQWHCLWLGSHHASSWFSRLHGRILHWTLGRARLLFHSAGETQIWI